MTPFCKVDSPTYFIRGIRGMVSFLKLYFFCHNFLENEKYFCLHTVT
ncbi:unnamed protein product, partial [Staurois parvus]